MGYDAETVRVKRSCAASLVAFAVGTLAAGAQATRAPIDVHSLGPQIGDRVPDFSLPDQYGAIQTLDGIMGSHGALILFHRSADW